MLPDWAVGWFVGALVGAVLLLRLQPPVAWPTLVVAPVLLVDGLVRLARTLAKKP